MIGVWWLSKLGETEPDVLPVFGGAPDAKDRLSPFATLEEATLGDAIS